MYAIVYRVSPRSQLRMWSQAFKLKEDAEERRQYLCRQANWQAWIIFFDDPR